MTSFAFILADPVAIDRRRRRRAAIAGQRSCSAAACDHGRHFVIPVFTRDPAHQRAPLSFCAIRIRPRRNAPGPETGA